AVADRAEILFPKPEERAAVELGIAADPVARVRMKRFAVAVAPCFCGVVPGFEVDSARLPVLFLAWKELTSLEQQHAGAERGQMVGQRPATGSAANHDHIVLASGFHALRFSEARPPQQSVLTKRPLQLTKRRCPRGLGRTNLSGINACGAIGILAALAEFE